MKDFMYKLLSPEENPSSASLIAILSGLTGVVISILPFIFNTIETSKTIETSRWLIGFAVGGKSLQHMIRRNR